MESPEENPPVTAPFGSPPERAGGENHNENDDDDDFEFAFVCDDSDSAITADEIFYDGKIRPMYPIFGRDMEVDVDSVRKSLRKLMIETETSCSSSESDELDGVPSDTYCLWTPGSVPPSPDMNKKKKSKSIGSSGPSFSRRFRLRDLVVGRSHSEGRKKFALVAPHPPAPPENGDGQRRRSAVSPKRFVSDQRRSYLPYRKDLVGIFASVQGTSRGFHPF